jgi:hypothetical protein
LSFAGLSSENIPKGTVTFEFCPFEPKKLVVECRENDIFREKDDTPVSVSYSVWKLFDFAVLRDIKMSLLLLTRVERSTFNARAKRDLVKPEVSAITAGFINLLEIGRNRNVIFRDA